MCCVASGMTSLRHDGKQILRAARQAQTRDRLGVAFGPRRANGGGFFVGGAVSERLADLEKRAGAIEVLLERTARLEEQGVAMRASLDRIERKIDRLSGDDLKVSK